MSDDRFRLRGRVWKFGDYIRGDSGILEFSLIRDHTKPFDEAELAANCFKPIRPDFAEQVQKGDIVVAGKGFANYNHPQVSLAIKAAGITVVFCESCEPSLVRKAVNVGLPVLPVPGITEIVEEGETLEVDLIEGTVRNRTNDRTLSFPALPARMLGIIAAGGVIEYLASAQQERGSILHLDLDADPSASEGAVA